jgi:hypothetical protein
VKLAVAGLLLLLSTLTACTVSAAGGIIGGAGALVFGVFLLFGASSQAGCGPKDPHANVCLSMPYIPDDAGPIENVESIDAGAELTPCLKVAMPDAGVPEVDAHIGPCLEVMPCLDVMPCLKPPPETPVNACLWMDAPGDDPLDLGGSLSAPVPSRADSLERIADKLPADVVKRLRGDD